MNVVLSQLINLLTISKSILMMKLINKVSNLPQESCETPSGSQAQSVAFLR